MPRALPVSEPRSWDRALKSLTGGYRTASAKLEETDGGGDLDLPGRGGHAYVVPVQCHDRAPSYLTCCTYDLYPYTSNRVASLPRRMSL